MVNIILPTPHIGQLQVIEEAKRFNILSCGRRWGKSNLVNWLIAEIIGKNLRCEFCDGIGKTDLGLCFACQGEGKLARDMAYMSPTYKNLLPVWRKFLKTFEKLITRTDVQNKSVQIMDLFYIEFWSLDSPENIRGREYIRVILDEAALVIALRETYELIISPTLNDLLGDLWMFSTPRGYNDFYYYHKLKKNPLFTDWASWIRPTSENPYFPKSELRTQLNLLGGDKFAQEYEGKFVALGNSPFDVENLVKCKTFEEALNGEVPLHWIRFWDIANSDKGDYTASTLMTITDEPHFILSNPVRKQGKWGSTYPFMKNVMLSEPHVTHIFETEGVGSIAWQVILADLELQQIKRLPADKRFTKQSKTERAMLWALELSNRRIKVVEGNFTQLLIDEIAAFPHGRNDDWVDSISGAMLAFVYFFGGYQQLLKSKTLAEHSGRRPVSYEKQALINRLGTF